MKMTVLILITNRQPQVSESCYKECSISSDVKFSLKPSLSHRDSTWTNGNRRPMSLFEGAMVKNLKVVVEAGHEAVVVVIARVEAGHEVAAYAAVGVVAVQEVIGVTRADRDIAGQGQPLHREASDRVLEAEAVQLFLEEVQDLLQGKII